MAVPDYQTLMLPVLRIAAHGETRVPDVVEQIANEFKLTPQERDQLLPSGGKGCCTTAFTGPNFT